MGRFGDRGPEQREALARDAPRQQEVGIAASDITTAFVAFAAAYASTRLSNVPYTGASSAG